MFDLSLYFRNLLKKFFPVLFFSFRFFFKCGYWPRVSNPRTINEHLLARKLFVDMSSLSIYVDKILVREFVSVLIKDKRLSNLFLTDILVCETTLRKFLSNIPSQSCFIKANHGSGMCFMKPYGHNLSQRQISTLRQWLSTDYFLGSGESCYKGISPQLFAELPIYCSNGELPDDVKVHCFYGRPYMIQLIRRTSGVLERKTFDINGNSVDWFQNEILDISSLDLPLSDIVSNSLSLSEGFEYVRCDYYLVDDKLYFGELTFIPAAASMPLSSYAVDLHLGAAFEKYKLSAKL